MICKSFVGAKLGSSYPVLLQLTTQGSKIKLDNWTELIRYVDNFAIYEPIY